jgi:hypothetical protein
MQFRRLLYIQSSVCGSESDSDKLCLVNLPDFCTTLHSAFSTARGVPVCCLAGNVTCRDHRADAWRL